ncbi:MULTISPECIES: sensor histidine kinase [unclassified Proteiniphilum]|jgi:two-component system OmpR family sensor kinase/two-component system phosphate regulon sensor histidine kinase PhoR|uniref:sensor histidine kinase n=1 Tax=unclassified Proteiniphilum TaxID=2622718 RepID=UPI00257A4E12|nr:MULTISPECIES: ATP-binding protein [unclassified Proteiniphilum]
MRRKVSFKKRILFYFSIIIAVFTVGIIFFGQQQYKEERTKCLERNLENNADIVYRYMNENNITVSDAGKVKELIRYLPTSLRFTIIDWQGDVMYDNLMDASLMENHLNRPEVKKSLGFGEGTHIRLSGSNNIKYLYYSKKYNEGFFIRMALPYNVEMSTFTDTGNSFTFIVLLFFIVCVLMMLYFTSRFTKSIKELREFSLKVKKGLPIPSSLLFADDEVGELSADIVESYNLLQQNKRKLVAEREKLLKHFQYSDEGIAIFSKDKRKIYANSRFLQFLNLILDKPTLETEQLFSDPNFTDIVAFIDNRSRDGNVLSIRIFKSGKQFNARVIIFDDNSFELYISDITKSEKTRLLKQEMTNNIAHELRTPVTSIRGYLETILSLYEKEGEKDEKILNFLDRAYVQTIRLSELMRDISMLTKIEDAAECFEQEPVQMNLLLKELASDMADKLSEKSDRFIVDVGDNVVIHGNRTLLYSIFRNLTENSVAYAGENIEIVISCYSESSDVYYFEFYDTGTGVEEKHLVRIFERFYRVNEGRTRITGGSGLGLSIVKNAVLFHKGSIVAKNRAEGGLMFLITFPKQERDNIPDASGK